MLEPVCNQKRFPVCRFNQVFQCIYFSVMDITDIAGFIISRTVCHLLELVAQGCCIYRIDVLPFPVFKDHFICHPVIKCLFGFRHGYGHTVAYAFRHIKIIHGFHGNADIGDQFIYFFFCSFPRLIRKDDLTIPLIRKEESVTVSSAVSSKPLPHIKDPDLCP